MKTTQIPAAAQRRIEQIAASTLCIETLETRKSDSLDFHEVAVWTIKEALEAAYLAGAETAHKGGAA